MFLMPSYGGAGGGPQSPPVAHPKTYEAVVPGLFRLELRSEKTSFSMGEPIAVTKRLTNLSSKAQTVAKVSLSEGLSLQRIGSSCGLLGDHAPGFTPRMIEVPQGSSAEFAYDLSSHPCFSGPGLYRASASYCRYPREHGLGGPLWCLKTEQLTVLVVKK